MDEAYTYQLWKMMDIQNEIKKIQSVSGVLAIRGYEIQLKADYFAKVVSLFDTWHFKPIKSDTYDHEVCGYINKKKFLALCTDRELIELLSGSMKNFAKEKPYEDSTIKFKYRGEPLASTKNNTLQVDCDDKGVSLKASGIEPSIMKMLETVFGKGNV